MNKYTLEESEQGFQVIADGKPTGLFAKTKKDAEWLAICYHKTVIEQSPSQVFTLKIERLEGD